MNKILFVDDEKLITNSLRRGLTNEPYESFFANSAKEALKIMEHEEIHVLVTDMKMPEITGLELLKIIQEKYPHVIKIVLSGYTQLPQVLITINQGDIFKFITKPWNLEDEFKPILREAVDFYNFKATQRAEKERLEKKNLVYQNMLKRYDDVIDDIRLEVKQVLIINSQIFNEINRLIINQPKTNRSLTDLLEIIILYEKLVVGILETIPTTQKRFSIQHLIDELTDYIETHSYITQLKVGIDSRLTKSYTGKYQFILQLLKVISSFTFIKQQDIPVSLVVSGQPVENNQEKISFVFEAGLSTIRSVDDILVILNILKLIVEKSNDQLTIRRLEKNMIILLEVTLDV